MKLPDPVNILTLKWGTRYGPHYVNRLFRGIEKHLRRPFRFLCFTDDPAGLNPGVESYPLPIAAFDLPENLNPSVWLKLALFEDDLAGGLRGPSLFLDLDLLVVSNIDCLFDYEPGKICIIHNWIEIYKQIFRSRPFLGNSSCVRFDSGTCQHVADQFRAEQEDALNFELYRTEQAYMTHCIRDRIAFWPEPWMRSFKRHCRAPFPLNRLTVPRFPRAAKLVVFHGDPNPDEALVGYAGRKVHHSVRPTPWIADHWSDA